MSEISRRDLVTRSIPALAVAGTMLGASGLLAADPLPAGAEHAHASSPLAPGFKDGKFVQAPLPYGYDTLEPAIDAQTMELHYSKHHATYVTNLNKAIDALAKLREAPEIDGAQISGLSRDISFNAGGHLLHSIFWSIMGKPHDGKTPDLEVTKAIAAQYGSLEKFQAHFNKVATTIKGSGWAIAWFEPVSQSILITDSGDQDNRQIPGATPILLLDVWEHAYYLKYQNKRPDYVKAWWTVVNWTAVNEMYMHLRGK